MKTRAKCWKSPSLLETLTTYARSLPKRSGGIYEILSTDMSCQMKVNFHFPTSSPCFEEECKEHNIELFVLPPRSPKLNCMVENKVGK